MLGVEPLLHDYEDEQDDHEEDNDEESIQPVGLVTANSLLILTNFLDLLSSLAITVILAVLLLNLAQVARLFPPSTMLRLFRSIDYRNCLDR